MYSIKTTQHFDAAHFLNDYNGQCSNIHGHRWKIEAIVQSPFIGKNSICDGMVLDFHELKELLTEEAKKFDHSLIIENGTLNKNTVDCLKKEGFKLVFVEFRPTAENLAYSIYMNIKNKGYSIKSVTVYETPNNSATYED